MADWERSFPKPQLSGHGWIIDVLQDLASYCDHNDLDLAQLEIIKLIARLSDEQSLVSQISGNVISMSASKANDKCIDQDEASTG